MSTYITSFAEVQRDGVWKKVGEIFPDRFFDRVELKDHPFGNQNYAVFGFLANVRNYSMCECVTYYYGLPDDVSQEIQEDYESWEEYHTACHCYLDDLLDVDYDREFENRRVTREIMPNVFNGAAIAKEGEGKMMTYKEHLGEEFFEHLAILKELGDPENVRVVYWFDG